MTDVHVLCNNDYPHSVFEDLAEAQKERERLNKEDKKRYPDAHPASLTGRVYYHLCTVPWIKEKQR